MTEETHDMVVEQGGEEGDSKKEGIICTELYKNGCGENKVR